MSAGAKPLSLDEFLAWERAEELRYRFDGVRPVGMTGAVTRHGRLTARSIVAAGQRLEAPCEVLSSELQVIVAGRVGYPERSEHGLSKTSSSLRFC